MRCLARVVYVVSRLQIDPMPWRTSLGVSVALCLTEIIVDDVLATLLAFGPLLAADHYLALNRPWGPDPHTDQDIGAAVWAGFGDLAGAALSMAIMTEWEREDTRQAREAAALATARRSNTGQPDAEVAYRDPNSD